jgi:hypothetical protein
MLRIYKRLWQITWAEQWQYRANLLMYLLYWLVSPIVYLAVWVTIANQQGSVNGLTANDFITYYLTLLVVDLKSEASGFVPEQLAESGYTIGCRAYYVFDFEIYSVYHRGVEANTCHCDEIPAVGAAEVHAPYPSGLYDVAGFLDVIDWYCQFPREDVAGALWDEAHRNVLAGYCVDDLVDRSVAARRNDRPGAFVLRAFRDFLSERDRADVVRDRFQPQVNFTRLQVLDVFGQLLGRIGIARNDGYGMNGDCRHIPSPVCQSTILWRYRPPDLALPPWVPRSNSTPMITSASPQLFMAPTSFMEMAYAQVVYGRNMNPSSGHR